MPKWSEIPWGQVFTGITSATAIVVSILSYRRAGPKLRFTVRTGVIKTRMDPRARAAAPAEVCANGGHKRPRRHAYDYRSCHFEKPWSWARLRNNPAIAPRRLERLAAGHNVDHAPAPPRLLASTRF